MVCRGYFKTMIICFGVFPITLALTFSHAKRLSSVSHVILGCTTQTAIRPISCVRAQNTVVAHTHERHKSDSNRFGAVCAVPALPVNGHNNQ